MTAARGAPRSTATVNDAALTGASGHPVAAVEGQPFQDLPVATFIDTNPLGAATDFTATIDWGDGTTSPASSPRSASAPRARSYQVLGSHTYTNAGAFPLGVTVTEASGANTTPLLLTATATVADAPLRSSGASIAGTEGVALTAQVAVFSDASPASVATGYEATIDWGDGTRPHVRDCFT